MTRFEFKERKAIRAEVIARICYNSGYKGCVCFSCGNAARELAARINTVRVCPDGDFQTKNWWTGEKIHSVFPDLFDATSGHLPAWAMERLALKYKNTLKDPFVTAESYLVPTGSGETIVALAMAFPEVRFRAEYNTCIATSFQQFAPLNNLVAALTNK